MVTSKPSITNCPFTFFWTAQTQGRASYTMQFDSYEPAPKSIVDEVMSKNA